MELYFDHDGTFTLDRPMVLAGIEFHREKRVRRTYPQSHEFVHVVRTTDAGGVHCLDFREDRSVSYDISKIHRDVWDVWPIGSYTVSNMQQGDRLTLTLVPCPPPPPRVTGPSPEQIEAIRAEANREDARRKAEFLARKCPRHDISESVPEPIVRNNFEIGVNNHA